MDKKSIDRKIFSILNELSENQIIDIKANCFNPKPKIESSLLHFTLRKDYVSLNYLCI